ncbi:hypothetical protein Ancab_023588 [Ancistrocladus abbreviatus]
MKKKADSVANLLLVSFSIRRTSIQTHPSKVNIKQDKEREIHLPSFPPISLLPLFPSSVSGFISLQMEQCSPFGWFHYNEEEEMQELKQFIRQTRMETEAAVLSAQDEISRKEEEVIDLKNLLMVTIKERDEAHSKCQKLLLQNLSLQQQLQQHQQQLKLQKAASFSRIASRNEEKHGVGLDTITNTSLSSSESEESIISSPATSTEHINPQNPFPSSLPPPQITLNLANQRPLPEKGNLLKAVMEAGPLLQTLLLAGPLPQWQHPPPQLDPIEIPPVTIPSPTPQRLLHQDPISSVNGCLGKKRGHDNNFDGSVSSSSCKYQRVVSH